ncbi:MAG: glycosyl transferase, family 2 [Actinomycetia bacterium]|nr:glycosyl transferase, family 2 [Actinomycetes bacterium]
MVTRTAVVNTDDRDDRCLGRVRTDGKHLVVDERPFRMRGVSYGSFVRRADDAPFPTRAQVKSDFARIAEAGFNTVRTYDLPPAELLDVAEECGLRVMVGLTYADWREHSHPGRRSTAAVLDAGRRAVAAAVERCAGRPEVFAISVGNEVPADLVRLHGARRIEHVLAALIDEIHQGDPDLLATYSNFPSTEYLRVDGQDLACFNVFLESPAPLRRYLRRLQVISGDVPLVITELGLASEIHGEEEQASSLRWQLQTVDEEGCAGASIFSWTDDWAVADVAVTGWGFGLTHEDRSPKPALDVASAWATRPLAQLRSTWPSVSVVVCAYNEERVIADCLDSLASCDYPALEVIVCDDGSTDRTGVLARQFGFRVLDLPHGGLSQARNAGIAAATGEIVAFLDADAMCHPEWPFHLALSLEGEGVVGTGGPNLPVARAGLVERAVALCPGNPVEVLVTDDRAEHVPGCNMAFRRDALLDAGGFDVVFTSAGDDVDLCWRLLDRDDQIAFSTTAQVRHHRRGTTLAYLRQQRGYGRAERLVAYRHRHRFNRLGQARWRGVIYGGVSAVPRLLRPIVYHGPMGFAPYQGIVDDPARQAMSWSAALLPMTLPIALEATAIGLLWPPAFVVAFLAVVAVLAYGATAALSVHPERDEPRPVKLRATVAMLHVLQPFVRTWGRVRARPPAEAAAPAGADGAWDGDRARWLDRLGRELRARRCSVRVGGQHDSWDVQANVGPFVGARLTTAVVWNWSPVVRTIAFPRRAAGLLVAVAFALGVYSFAAGAVALGVALTTMAAEAVLLRRAVHRSVSVSTAGARSDG